MTAKAKILIVDDEANTLASLSRAFRLAGHEAVVCDNAARGLAVAQSEPFDLILSDVVMPGMDGFELLRRLKAAPETQHVPVIFVTAMDEIDDEERGLLLGAVDYITKPIRPAIVRARVRTHVELKTQRDLLEQRALIDGLTGIPNRRRFDQELDARWRAAQRSGSPLSLLLIDVDHFKQFNDSYGHGAGDDCLRRVAGAIAAACNRSGDLAARYGGEEFAVILPGAAADTQLRRLLGAIRALGIPHRASSAADVVTASVGGVEVVPDGSLAAAQALERADQQLYAAKKEGRNRCVHLRLADGERRVLFAEEAP